MIHDYSALEGVEALREIYGESLCFHDAEVVRIELVRGNVDLGEVNLVADIHTFQVERIVPDTRMLEYGKHHVVRLMFQDIQNLQLEGFNHQNALMDLTFRRLEPSQNGAVLSVTFQPAFGVGASFTCFKARVVAVKEGKPESSAHA